MSSETAIHLWSEELKKKTSISLPVQIQTPRPWSLENKVRNTWSLEDPQPCSSEWGPSWTSTQLFVLSGQGSLQSSISIEVLMSPKVLGSPKPSPMSPEYPNNCQNTVGLRKKKMLTCTQLRLTMPLQWHHSPIHLLHTTLISFPLWHCQSWNPFTHILEHTAASTFIQKTDIYLRWRTVYKDVGLISS